MIVGARRAHNLPAFTSEKDKVQPKEIDLATNMLFISHGNAILDIVVRRRIRDHRVVSVTPDPASGRVAKTGVLRRRMRSSTAPTAPRTSAVHRPGK